MKDSWYHSQLVCAPWGQHHKWWVTHIHLSVSYGACPQTVSTQYILSRYPECSAHHRHRESPCLGSRTACWEGMRNGGNYRWEFWSLFLLWGLEPFLSCQGNQLTAQIFLSVPFLVTVLVLCLQLCHWGSLEGGDFHTLQEVERRTDWAGRCSSPQPGAWWWFRPLCTRSPPGFVLQLPTRRWESSLQPETASGKTPTTSHFQISVNWAICSQLL